MIPGNVYGPETFLIPATPGSLTEAVAALSYCW
jgi:hypothetical protein